MITRERVTALLSYNKTSGLFRWLEDRGRGMKGKIAGTPDSKGYIQIRIDGVKYRASRLAFLVVEGVPPLHQVDHVNRDRSDNKWLNLRNATSSQNAMNRNIRTDNSSGTVGVHRRPDGRWQARITVDGTRVSLGHFDSLKRAIKVRSTAAKKHYGEFSADGESLRG